MGTPRVYGMSSSGNCYKVRLLLEQLPQAYEWIEIDVRTGATRQPEFLGRNPNGRVPTLEYEPGKYLAESDAILVYLAEGSGFWPQQRLQRAQALQWMFFEQYSHEPYIAVARFISTMLPAQHERRAELPRLHERGYQALAVMEQHLARARFLVGDAYSIADIALYAYTHAAGDGGFDLQRFPALRAWIARVESQPHFVPMPPVA
ncbi:MAG TPA: glutathione S-transferase family protein [Steroidobacteraceae bacterium]|jgi:glutathione S-transferase|nr:glutathione S-transferase family protein [Steroidobacteraceae bacterium]